MAVNPAFPAIVYSRAFRWNQPVVSQEKYPGQRIEPDAIVTWSGERISLAGKKGQARQPAGRKCFYS